MRLSPLIVWLLPLQEYFDTLLDFANAVSHPQPYIEDWHQVDLEFLDLIFSLEI